MRKSHIFLIFSGFNLALCALLGVHGVLTGRSAEFASRRVVRELKLTDLCLFTEARYTRHPAMADRHAAFQDHPFALEHFPSGSLLLPPPSMRRSP